MKHYKIVELFNKNLLYVLFFFFFFFFFAGLIEIIAEEKDYIKSGCLLHISYI